jgi:hypothetical protein
MIGRRLDAALCQLVLGTPWATPDDGVGVVLADARRGDERVARGGVEVEQRRLRCRHRGKTD